MTQSTEVLTFNEFQQASQRTLPEGPVREQVLLCALALTAEAAEAGQLIKKWACDGPHAMLDEVALMGELGEVLRYVAALASFWKIQLENIAMQNLKKLHDRYPARFSPAELDKWRPRWVSASSDDIPWSESDA